MVTDSLLMMMLRKRETDKHSRKHCEYVSLNEGNKELKTIHKENHYETEYCQSTTEERIQLPSNEDDCRE